MNVELGGTREQNFSATEPGWHTGGPQGSLLGSLRETRTCPTLQSVVVRVKGLSRGVAGGVQSTTFCQCRNAPCKGPLPLPIIFHSESKMEVFAYILQTSHGTHVALAQPSHNPRTILAQPLHGPHTALAQPSHSPCTSLAQPLHGPHMALAQPSHSPCMVLTQSLCGSHIAFVWPAHSLWVALTRLSYGPCMVLAQSSHDSFTTLALPIQATTKLSV